MGPQHRASTHPTAAAVFMFAAQPDLVRLQALGRGSSGPLNVVDVPYRWHHAQLAQQRWEQLEGGQALSDVVRRRPLLSGHGEASNGSKRAELKPCV